ncbi:hypothetical protein CK203_093273 [Vitis vinifera]|uniref:Uncharacterized protein n=1 Tax=Vitis vinifera TaxID=29760 RepID=A0A438CMJ0_VITVI|nr:hypothetical protein CK203_093273 [Vitis vinifera]
MQILKGLVHCKKRVECEQKAFLTGQVSAIMHCKSLVKYKDLGCPTISMSIGGLVWEKALLDLGATYPTEEEEDPEEVCMIDTLVEEHCDQRMQEDLIESFGDLDEGLPEPSDLLATLSPEEERRNSTLIQ